MGLDTAYLLFYRQTSAAAAGDGDDSLTGAAVAHAAPHSSALDVVGEDAHFADSPAAFADAREPGPCHAHGPGGLLVIL